MRIRPLTLALFAASLCGLSAAFSQGYLSPCDIECSKDGKKLHIVAATGNRLLDFDLTTRQVAQSLSLPSKPTGFAQAANGQVIYVAGGGHEGRVWKIHQGAIAGEFKTGHTPVAPVLSPDGSTLYVCNQFNNDVSFIDTETGETIARVDAIREPVAADLTPDGTVLFVANLLPDGRADADYVAAKITAIDIKTRTPTTIPLVNGAEGVRGIKVSPDGNHAFATHRLARFLVPTTQLERGWISTDALSVIRVSDKKLLYTVLLDDVDQGFTNPWAIDFCNDGNTLVVSSAGNHEISLIDYPAMMRRIAEKVTDSGAMESSNLSFLSGIRERIKLDGNGPRSLAVDGEFVYVAHYYSDTLEIIRIPKGGNIKRGSFALGPKPVMTQERLGEIYFNDATLCFQNWLSCATCHPDARTDGLNWDLLNDGIGNPKNAKSMLLAHATPPAMWLGVRADAEAGVRAGLRHIQFSVRPEEDSKAIDAYLKSLRPVPSPFLVDGRLSDSAQRGQDLFNGLGCARCHPAPLYTNLKMIAVGTTKGQDQGKPVDVPTLIEAWRTAPYLHDGRAATILDALKTQDHAGILQRTSSLTDEELNELAEYILSL